MTKRASLTPAERRVMYEDQDRLCALCCEYAPLDRMIAEHWVTVESGNDQKPDCLLCIPCAHRKTYGTPATSYGSDTHERAKVKRIQKKLAGKTRKGRAIQSRGFDTPPPGYSAWPPKGSQKLASRPMRREEGR